MNSTRIGEPASTADYGPTPKHSNNIGALPADVTHPGNPHPTLSPLYFLLPVSRSRCSAHTDAYIHRCRWLGVVVSSFKLRSHRTMRPMHRRQFNSVRIVERFVPGTAQDLDSFKWWREIGRLMGKIQNMFLNSSFKSVVKEIFLYVDVFLYGKSDLDSALSSRIREYIWRMKGKSCLFLWLASLLKWNEIQ